MSDPIASILALGVLNGIGAEVLRALDPPPELRTLTAGETLIRQGEPGAAFYVLARGRLRVFVAQPAGGVRAVADLVPGDGLGEISLLLDEPTTATVCALRDGVAIRFSRAAFMQLLELSPTASLGAARALAQRLKEGNLGAPAAPRQRTPNVTLLPLHGGLDVAAFAGALAAALRPLLGRVELVDTAALSAATPEPPPHADAGLDELEQRDRLTLYPVLPNAPPAWWRLLAQRADHLLLLGAVGSDPAQLVFDPARLGLAEPLLAPRTDLVLLHGGEWSPDPGTRAWLERLRVDQWHHLRAGNPQDFGRLARVLSGNDVTLVLGGGNAPALAQIGVLRALAEAGLPVDRIVGTSMGAVTGAHAALGYDPDTVERVAEELWRRSLSLADRLSPARALRRGQRLRAHIHASCRGRRIADLPLPLAIATPDAESRAELAERGDLGTLVEHSLSRPGAGAAVFLDEPLFLHDGLPATLPVEAAAARFGGRLIAVDVAAAASADAGAIATPAGLGRRLLADNNRRHVDLTIAPRLPTSAPHAFGALAAFADAGRRATFEALRDAPEPLARLLPAGIGGLPADLGVDDGRRAAPARRARRRALAWSAAAGVVVIAAALAVWRQLDTPLPSAPPPPAAATEGLAPLPVAWVPVKHQPAFETLDHFSGTVQSRRRGTLSLSRNGRVATVLVDEGDRVGAGAILLQLDTRELETRRESLTFDFAQQQAAVASVAADLPTALATLERQERLVANGHATQQTIDEARSRVAVLKAEHLSAQAAASAVEARLRGVEVELETSVLKAPYAGTITERRVDEGVAVNPATPLLTLVEDGIKRVRAGLPPEVALTLSPGATAPVEVGATATTARLRALVPALDAATRTIPAVFEIDDPDRRLPDGALARIALRRMVPARGTWLPDTALLGGPRGLWTVYVLVPAGTDEDGVARVERRAVQVLHDQGGRVFVDGTLEDGERVVATGVDRVVPGQRVAPRPDPEPEGGLVASDGSP